MAFDDEAEIPSPPAAFEEREILGHVLRRVREDEASVQTLDWAMREVAGEQLKDIAKETGLSACALRQRVSRWCRMLRAEWLLGPTLLVLVLGGAIAHGRHTTDGATRTRPSAITRSHRFKARGHVVNVEGSNDAMAIASRAAIFELTDHHLEVNSRAALLHFGGDVHVVSSSDHHWSLTLNDAAPSDRATPIDANLDSAGDLHLQLPNAVHVTLRR